MFKFKLKRFSAGLSLVIVMIILISMGMSTGIFGANESVQQDLSNLEVGKTLDGPGFFAGSVIRIDGTVNGTTFVTGQDVTITGDINGDLIVAAQTIDISGKVKGNIYTAGQNLSFGGQTEGDVFLAGQTIKIDKDGVIGRDLFAGADSIFQYGTVKRDFNGGATNILISGLIERDANLEAVKIEIQETAIITGDLSYTSERQAYVAPGSNISGQTDWSMPVIQEKAKNTNKAFKIVISKLLALASALLIWFVIVMWKPSFWKKTTEMISQKPVKTLGIGAIALIVTPILAVLVMITIIGIPLGFLLVIAYGVSLYLSKIVAAVFLGSWIAKRLGWSEIHKGFWTVLLGLIIISGLGMIPVLGFIVWLFILFAGLGSIIVSNFKSESQIVEKI